MELEGNLQQFPLAELLTMIVYSSVSGMLELRSAGFTGQIYSRDGRLYHATADGQEGIDALYRIFERVDARFCFQADTSSRNETIWQDAWDLIAQAERRAVAWARVRPYIPSLSCIPVLRQAPSDARIQINETGWAVLARIDGEHSIDEIAVQLGQVALEVAEALVGLMQQGIVQIKPPRPSAPPASAPQPPPAGPPPGILRSPIERNASLWQRLRR